MYRSILLMAAALVIGCSNPQQAAARPGSASSGSPASPAPSAPPASPGSPASPAPDAPPSSAPAPTAQGRISEADAMDFSKLVLDAFARKSFTMLANLAHPIKGVRVSHDAMVQPDTDVVLTAAELRDASTDGRVRTWGIAISDKPIRATVADYFGEHFFRRFHDMPLRFGAFAPGTHPGNLQAIYPEGVFFEWYVPGEPPTQEYSWSAVRVVLEEHQGHLYVVGLVLDRWIP